MNAFELHNEKGNPTGVWCCGQCRKLVLSPLYDFGRTGLKASTQEAAERCCRDPICETCQTPCSAEDARQSADKPECGSCRSERFRQERLARYAELLARAVEAPDYDGPVMAEYTGARGDWGDDYFSTVDELPERVLDAAEDGATLPEWAFCCKPDHKQLDIGDMLERICDDGYEDMSDFLTVPPALKAAVDEFNTVNAKALTCWNVDYSKKVRVKPAEPE